MDGYERSKKSAWFLKSFRVKMSVNVFFLVYQHVNLRLFNIFFYRASVNK